VDDCDVRGVDDAISVVDVVVEGNVELVMLSVAVVEVGMDVVGLSVDVNVKDDKPDSMEDMLMRVVELGGSADVTMVIGVVTKVRVPVDGADSVETVEGTFSVDG
jgi:hypothetical protein